MSGFGYVEVDWTSDVLGGVGAVYEVDCADVSGMKEYQYHLLGLKLHLLSCS